MNDLLTRTFVEDVVGSLIFLVSGNSNKNAKLVVSWNGAFH